MSSTKKTDFTPAEESKKQKPEIIKNVDYEEDEFEEFETLNSYMADTGNNANSQDNVNVWEDNWDDECAETDFSKQLKYAFINFKFNKIIF